MKDINFRPREEAPPEFPALRVEKRARRARRVYDTPIDDKRSEVGVMAEHT